MLRPPLETAQLNLDPLGWSLVVVGRACGAAEVSVFEWVGVAAEGDDFGVVDEPVDHGGGDDFVAEDFRRRGRMVCWR